MFFIPVRQSDHAVRRWPIITILLVLANLALYATVVWVARDDDPRELQARIVESVHYHAAHPYLEAPAGLAAAEKAANIVIATRGDPPITVSSEQGVLDGMWKTVEEMQHASIAYNYGDRPARGGALTLLTSLFLHASLPHVLFNMWFLWLVGCTLEDRWGRILYGLFYLAAGIAATLTHRAFSPMSDIPVIGASGAVAGAMGAFLVRSARSKIELWGWFVIPFRLKVPAYLILPLWLAFELFAGLSANAGGNVAHWAHVGGFVFGAAAGTLIWVIGLESAIDTSIERAVTATARATPITTPTSADDFGGIVRVLAADGASDIEVANTYALARARGVDAKLRAPLRLRGARALERVGRIAEADAAYLAIHNNAPADATGLNALLAHAELMLAQRRRDDARRLFEAARSSPLPHDHLDSHIEKGLRRTG